MARNADIGPDDIEREIIRIASAVPGQARAENWPSDHRSRAPRLIARWWAKNTGASWQQLESYDDQIFTEQWMRAIISGLEQLGLRLGYRTIRHNPYAKRYSWEWMWDLAWVKYDGEHHLVSLPLIVEFALGKGDVFGKLVSTRAEHRVFITEARYPGNEFDRLKSEVLNFGMTQRGDRYLFLYFSRDAREFNSLIFVVGKL